MLLLTAPPTRSDWIALAKGGFVVPSGRTAADMLTEMNQLLGSNDPVLRDDVAFSAAERWILRDRRLSPSELRGLLRLWITISTTVLAAPLTIVSSSDRSQH